MFSSVRVESDFKTNHVWVIRVFALHPLIQLDQPIFFPTVEVALDQVVGHETIRRIERQSPFEVASRPRVILKPRVMPHDLGDEVEGIGNVGIGSDKGLDRLVGLVESPLHGIGVCGRDALPALGEAIGVS